MRTRTAIQPGCRPFIRSLLIIAGLLGTYAALQPPRAFPPDDVASLPVHGLSITGWSRTV